MRLISMAQRSTTFHRFRLHQTKIIFAWVQAPRPCQPWRGGSTLHSGSSIGSTRQAGISIRPTASRGGIPLVEDNKITGAIGCSGATARRMRWYAGRRGNDQVAHYFAADRCVKEPVYLALESTRPWPQLDQPASNHDGRTVVTPPTTRTSKPNPSRPETPSATYVAIVAWRSDAPVIHSFSARSRNLLAPRIQF